MLINSNGCFFTVKRRFALSQYTHLWMLLS
ncbi:hypothetical protein vBEcoMWL3_gp076 [Escherichia phage vB_EcoM_WL-3]|nr:hypothetical protein vBEcoMWL3_gp076 [Escherichia phage vB_EcoM_WL-3]